MDKAEFLRHAASLSPEEKAALFGVPSAASRSDGRPPWKWQHIVDAIPDADVAKVVNACRAGLKHAFDHRSDESRDAESEAVQMLGEVHATLAAAARSSSQRRGKPVSATLAGIASYLQSEASHAKREAARRRIPVTPAPTTTAATADASAGKGGGK